MIIEWNSHLFSNNLARFPWHPRAVYQPDLASCHTDPLAVYLAQMQAQGIDRAVVVQPEPYGDDHRLLLDALAREPERLRGVSLFYPDDAAAPDKLSALVAREPRIIATRFHAHRGKDMYLRSFDDPGVHALWERAAALNLVVELHIGADYAPQIQPLLRAFPNTPVLIDHMCEPAFSQMHEISDVLALADFDTVYMKLSGVTHFARQPAPYADARAFVRLLAHAFGPQRLLWGSAGPAWLPAMLADWPPADIAAVMGGNARKFFTEPA